MDNNSCYLCGKTESHSYDCPKSAQILPTVQLSTPIPIVTFKIKDKIWRIAVVKYKDIIPLWVTHAWYRDGYHLGRTDVTLEELARDWERACNTSDGALPWHTLRFKGLIAGEMYDRTFWEMLVFGLL